VKCLDSCNGDCDINNITHCLNCAVGYYLKDDVSCGRCPIGCSICDSNKCVNCFIGYKFIDSSQSCELIC
jgi:hypothetical protein